MIRSCMGLAAAATLALGAASAHAQTWEVLPADDGSSVVAVQWDSGAAWVARCGGGTFSFMFRPAHQVGETSTARVRTGEDPWERVIWTASADASSLFAGTPARLARLVARGGEMEMRFAPDDAPSVLYRLDLPQDAAPLQAVMTACGVPLSNARDLIPILDELEWARRPIGNDIAALYPNPTSGLSGNAQILCRLTALGRLEDCEVTFETPPGAGFGRATEGLAPRFRIERDQAREFEGWLVQIPVAWRLG